MQQSLPKGVHENELDLKAVDMLTRKIAEDLGSGFLNSDDEDEEDDEDDGFYFIFFNYIVLNCL